MSGCGKRVVVPYLASDPTEEEIAAQIETARTWPYKNLPPPLIGQVFRQIRLACGDIVGEGYGFQPQTILCSACAKEAVPV